MLALREPLNDHPWIELEHRIVLEHLPVLMVPDRPPKILLVALLEVGGFDTGCIVRRWNGRVVGVLESERDSHGISRFGLDFHERPLQLLFEFGIPRAIVFLYQVIHWFFGVVVFRLASLVLLGSLSLDLWFFSIGLISLSVIARAIPSALLMPMPVLLAVMV
jgi:hypothetical protein